jgi:hypothetical protein
MQQFIVSASHLISHSSHTQTYSFTPQLNSIPPLPRTIPQHKGFSPFNPHNVVSLSVVPHSSALPLSQSNEEASQTPSFSQIAQNAYQKNLQDPYSSIPPPLPLSDKSRVKINYVQRIRSLGRLVCFRCGDQGHQATSCRNALVCFPVVV